MANTGMVLLGIVIIGAIYMFPVHTVSVPSLFGSPSQYSLTVASIVSLCSNWLVGTLGGSECSFYQGVFYLGWIIGGGLVLAGLFKK